jgi:hypothetical protein
MPRRGVPDPRTPRACSAPADGEALARLPPLEALTPLAPLWEYRTLSACAKWMLSGPASKRHRVSSRGLPPCAPCLRNGPLDPACRASNFEAAGRFPCAGETEMTRLTRGRCRKLEQDDPLFSPWAEPGMPVARLGARHAPRVLT